MKSLRLPLDLNAALWSTRNSVDFALRGWLGVAIRRGNVNLDPREVQAAIEIGQFLSKFKWPKGSGALKVVDIGCRNFFLAPEIDGLFRKLGWDAEVHGVEIDAHRRMKDLRTRKQYGTFYAEMIPKGLFHPMDFLDWKEKVDIALLLHPFVTKRSILAWGLPLKHLKPKEMIRHCAKLLKPGGLLLVSAPSHEELDISSDLAVEAGLKRVGRGSWEPTEKSSQKKPRYGSLFSKKS